MKRKLIVLTLVILALALASGCTRIGPGHAGIKIDNAGSNKGVLSTPIRTGWVFYLPGSSSVIEFPTFMQTAKWTKSLDEGKAIDESVTFTNKDSMTINADVSLSYTLNPDKVPAFYVKFVTDDLSTFTHGFLRNVARDCLNERAGQYAIEQIMGDNAPFLKEARACIQGQVGGFGVNIEQFGIIGAPRPPAEVVKNINQKVQAQQLGLQKVNELQQVQADAAKQVAESEGAAKAQIARAKGEAEANRIRAASLTPSLLELRKLENAHDAIWRWNGGMPHVLGGSGGSFLYDITK